AEVHPLHAVTSWLGNSQLVAARHYLQLRDEHFERAAAGNAEATDPRTDPKTHEDGKTGQPPKKTTREKPSVFAGLLQSSVVYQPGEWAQQDLNL
ncbi:MAG: hypothetical protein RLZZ458_670, partial [Planctomycetota bacterium]